MYDSLPPQQVKGGILSELFDGREVENIFLFVKVMILHD